MESTNRPTVATRPTVEPDDRHRRPPEETCWLARVFPTGRRWHVYGTAALGAGTLYLLGFLVSLTGPPGPDDYLREPMFHLGAVGVFIELLLLGQWTPRYAATWREMRTCFADPTKYDRLLERRLRLVYHDGVHVGLFLAYHVFVLATLFRWGTMPETVIRLGYLTVLHFLGSTAVWLYSTHLWLVWDVATLELGDVPRATKAFRSVVDVGLGVGIKWFAAVAVLVLYVQYVLGVGFGETNPETHLLAVAGLGSFAYAHLLLVSLLTVVGFLAFFGPLWLLHRALERAREDQILELEVEYWRLFEQLQAKATPTDRLVVGLYILERRRRATLDASTWPSNAASVVELAVSFLPTALVVLEAVRAL